jgi:hypothetical protein
MMNWLSISLKADLEHLCSKVRLPDYSSVDSGDSARRRLVLEVAASLPGLRMCERRKLFLLAQSAPLVDMAKLSEQLSILQQDFDKQWNRLTSVHEFVISNCRSHLIALSSFVDQLESVYTRREDAIKLLERLEDGRSGLSTGVSAIGFGFEPIFSYSGFEVDSILPSLREVKFPDIIARRPARPRFDTVPDLFR